MQNHPLKTRSPQPKTTLPSAQQKRTLPACAKLNKLNISPRKARLLTPLLRRKTVAHALRILHFQTKKVALPLRKLLLSAVANWKQNKANNPEQTNDHLYIQQIYVNSAGMSKRIKPAPQGRAHQIRKRAAHINLFIDKYTPTPSTPTSKAQTSK